MQRVDRGVGIFKDSCFEEYFQSVCIGASVRDVDLRLLQQNWRHHRVPARAQRGAQRGGYIYFFKFLFVWFLKEQFLKLLASEISKIRINITKHDFWILKLQNSGFFEIPVGKSTKGLGLGLDDELIWYQNVELDEMIILFEFYPYLILA